MNSRENRNGGFLRVQVALNPKPFLRGSRRHISEHRDDHLGDPGGCEDGILLFAPLPGRVFLGIGFWGVGCRGWGLGFLLLALLPGRVVFDSGGGVLRVQLSVFVGGGGRQRQKQPGLGPRRQDKDQQTLLQD